ncbi:MAG: ribonuclease HII [Parachlamydiaceae bacterium]|nr:ribonuclease HII [Parachlamydiaceae bacterium]
MLKSNSSKLSAKERRRLETLTLFEKEARLQGYNCIAGLDEAGRGPLAGPVVAAACIVPEGVFFSGIDDSKKLSAKERDRLFDQIKANTVYSIGIITSLEIDRINIYQATIKAMLSAVATLTQLPQLLLVDGMNLPHPSITCQKIIQGDAKSQSIAAASILAKVTRDRMMAEFDLQWPEYEFKQHKGYGTPKHLDAIAKHGPCAIHRMTFEPLKRSNQLEFCL